MSENIIGTNNQAIIDFVTKRKKLDKQTTNLLCAKCGKENKISNYEFINNFEVYYVEKGFSIIDFTCYNCKEKYELSASINTFSTKIIEESLSTAVDSLNKLIFNKFQNKPTDELSKKLIETQIIPFEEDSDLKYMHDESLFEMKQELKNISFEAKHFLINCGMLTMKEIYKQILDEIK